MTSSAIPAAWDAGRRSNPLTTALALALLGLLGSGATGWLSYRSSRAQILDAQFAANLTLARALAAHPGTTATADRRAALAELEEVWRRSRHRTAGAPLGVVGPDGTLALHTGRPDLVGRYAGGLALVPAGNGPSTVAQLLRQGGDWVGMQRDLVGADQLAAYAHSEALGGLVVVYLGRERLDLDIRRKVLPWGLGLGGVALIFVLALAILARSYASQRRQLTDTLVELGASRLRYQDLYENAPDMFLSIDTASGRITECNERLARILGRSKLGLCGSHVLAIFDESSREKLLGSFEAFQRTGVVRDLELRLQPASGPTIDVLLNASAVRDAAGRVIASRSILRDVSALRRAEADKDQLLQALRHSQRLEALGTLAGGIAHDFNNILLSIAGYTELIAADLEPGSPARAHMTEVLRGADRAKALVGNILTFSRKRTPHRVAVRLRRVVEEAGAFLRASISSRVGIELDTGDGDPCVLADANQLHQVVVNLGLNASQAIGPHEGTIAIALDTIEAASGEAAGAPVRYARIRVRDDGRGMGPDVMSRIFEPYFTTRDTDEGTGLGLAVVDGILQAHEGSITVRSEAGRGSEFEVRLPILDSASEPPVEPPSTRPSGGGERILVLDDEPGLTRLAERRLGGLGYRVTAATEVEEARQAIRTEGAPFDLLITDQNLRHATGLDFVAELRAAGCDLPVILATGTPDEIEPSMARTLRIDRVLAKPYSLDQLAGVVRAVLDRG